MAKRTLRFYFSIIAGVFFSTISNSSCRHVTAVRVDGIYQSEKDAESTYDYLRFYPDGTVIEVSSTAESKEVLKWLDKNLADVSKGTYDVADHHVKFPVKNSYGTVDYEGDIVGDRMVLKQFSHINNYRGSDNYTFIKK